MAQIKNRMISLLMVLMLLVGCVPMANAEDVVLYSEPVGIATSTDIAPIINEMSDPEIADASPTVKTSEDEESQTDESNEIAEVDPGDLPIGEYPHDPEPTEQPVTIPEDHAEAETPATLQEIIDKVGYAYAMLCADGYIYADRSMSDESQLYVTHDVGSVVLCTGYKADKCYEVWLMDDNGDTVTGYIDQFCLDEYALTDEMVGIFTQIVDTNEVKTPVGRRIIFLVDGEYIEQNENEPDDTEISGTNPVTSDEDETTAEDTETIDLTDIPADDEEVENEDNEPSTTPTEDETDPVTSDEEEPIDDAFLVVDDPEDTDTQMVGDYLRVTTNTRAFLDVSKYETLETDNWVGHFVKDATVKIAAVQHDEYGRTWYKIAFLYGDDFKGGAMKWTATDYAWVLADEVQTTSGTELTVTDYAYKTRPMSSRVSLHATAMNGFTLKNINVNLGSFQAWQSGLYGSSGRDSDYPQIAKSAAHGNIYATPHYLEGYSVFCLEHNLSGPGEGSGSSQKPKGPYVLVDMDGFTSGPSGGGVSGVRYKASTMHAIGWVLRHTYPYMALDRSDSNNLVWSRVAGQFAIREVIKQLEGAQYVRDYWDMANFYSFSGGAPSVYLEYARWLATNGIARASITGRITTSNVSVSVSGSSYIGSVKLTTDADLIRIPKSVGTLTGNTGGYDNSYYYAKSGDTIKVTSGNARFSISMESISSSDEEAGFLIGIPSVEIQKILVPTQTAPYAIQSASVTFELSNGDVVVTKKSTDGILLPGTVFELLSSSGTVLKTATTDSTGKATFSGLNPGTYVVREKTPSQGYLLAAVSSQNVTVTAGTTTTATFTNERITGKVRVVKKDSITEQPLPGATFSVIRLSGPAADNPSDIGRVVATITTGANGIAETGPLPWGEYQIKETGVPDGYLDDGYTVTTWIK